MGLKLGRKGQKASDQKVEGTPVLSEASLDENHSMDEKQNGKDKPIQEVAKEQVAQPVSFRSLFRYVATHSFSATSKPSTVASLLRSKCLLTGLV